MEEGLLLATVLQGGNQRNEYTDVSLCHSVLCLNLTRIKRMRETFREVHTPAQLLRVLAGWEGLGSDLWQGIQGTGQDKGSVLGHPSSPLSA